MVPVTAFSTLLVLLCLTAQSTAQVDCSDISALINAGDCNFYDCLNTKFQCGPTDYPLAYGKRYCLRFANESSCFTKQVNDLALIHIIVDVVCLDLQKMKEYNHKIIIIYRVKLGLIMFVDV